MGTETHKTDGNAEAPSRAGLVCPCGNAKTARQTLCKKCTTRNRVQKHRGKTVPLRALKVPIENDYLAARRRTSVKLRDAGKFSVETAKSEHKKTKSRLRKESKQTRDTLTRVRKALWKEALRGSGILARALKGLTPALKKEIQKADDTLNKAIQETDNQIKVNALGGIQ